MSIRERALKYAENYLVSQMTTDALALRLTVFAESERALQRQECAEAVRLWWSGEDSGIASGKWWDELKTAILSAGTEPQNPFGCGCEWKLDKHFNRWVLSTGSVYFYSTSCDHCPRCGAKRRE